MNNETSNNIDFTDLIALIGFRLEAIEDLLFEKGIITREEFKNIIYSKIDRGEIPETKELLKTFINNNY